MDSKEEMYMELDMAMHEIFASLFNTEILNDFDDLDRDLIYNHMRLAFVMGRMQGQRDMQPIIDDHCAEIRRIMAALKEF